MRPASIQPVGLVGFILFAGLKLITEEGLERGLHILNFAFWDQSIGDEAFSIKAQRCFLLFDFIVHQGVGEHWFIPFVMAKAAVTDDVNHHIFVEFLTEFDGNFSRVHDGLWIIAIHVENRRLDHQGNIRWIGR